MAKRKIRIKGKVVYMPLETGFWGIEGSRGRQWRPVNMPEKLKKEGLEVDLEGEAADEEFSLFMWGKPVKITKVHS